MKKRSGASFRSKRDSPLELFVDRCLGRKILPDELRKLPRIAVHIHDDHFAPDEKDHVWLPQVAVRGWVILTKDKDIRHRKTELDAVLANDAYLLTFSQGDYTAREMAEAFRLALPKIRRSVAGFFPPFVARISKTGDFLIL